LTRTRRRAPAITEADRMATPAWMVSNIGRPASARSPPRPSHSATTHAASTAPASGPRQRANTDPRS
jgi:hypothetical protein